LGAAIAALADPTLQEADKARLAHVRRRVPRQPPLFQI
jgi:hypothetical protein